MTDPNRHWAGSPGWWQAVALRALGRIAELADQRDALQARYDKTGRTLRMAVEQRDAALRAGDEARLERDAARKEASDLRIALGRCEGRQMTGLS